MINISINRKLSLISFYSLLNVLLQNIVFDFKKLISKFMNILYFIIFNIHMYKLYKLYIIYIKKEIVKRLIRCYDVVFYAYNKN